MSGHRRRAFSLLEVIFAMSILLGSIAVLGELSSIGTRNARTACDLTMAELLCETKLNEIVARSESPEPADEVPFEDHPEWLYSVSVEEVPVAQPGLLTVRVTVTQDVSENKRPLSFMLVRWIRGRSTPSAAAAESATPEPFAFPPPASRRGY